MPVDQEAAGQGCCEVRVAVPRPRCLVCGGDLVPVRAAWRCTRCGHALCSGCDPGTTPDPPEGTD